MLPLTPFTRLAGALGLTAFLLYCGAAIIAGGDLDAAALAGWTLLALAIGFAGVWSISHLHDRRGLIGTLVVAGVLPLVTALAWAATGEPGETLRFILWANALLGLAATALAGWSLTHTGVHDGARTGRVARI